MKRGFGGGSRGFLDQDLHRPPLMDNQVPERDQSYWSAPLDRTASSNSKTAEDRCFSPEREGSSIRFGSFSLGDVIEREILKFGRFAMRGKHSKGEASKKFIDEFIKLRAEELNLKQSIEEHNVRVREERNSEGEKGTTSVQSPAQSPQRPSYPHGTCIDDLYNHSWSDRVGFWVWVPKGSALTAADQGLGFPATHREIERFGRGCKRVVKVRERKVDGRSYAAVAAMEQHRGGPHRRPGGAMSRLGDRGGPGRHNDGRIFNSSEGNFRDRVWNQNDFERDSFRGGFGGQNSFTGGDGSDPRRNNWSSNSNKRHLDERDRSEARNNLEREEQDLRAKLRKDQEEHRFAERSSKADEGWEMKGKGRINPGLTDNHCFNCNLKGHFRKDCSNPPFCYCCKKSGHRSSVCPEKRGLRLCGFGLPGQGFYSIHIPTDKEERKKEVLGIMTIEYGFATTDIIEKELRHLYKDRHKWTIRKLQEDKYLITFPDEKARQECTKFRGFDFETAIIKASVKETTMSANADGNLEVVWVKGYNFPPNAKTVEVVMELAYLVGDPEEVDLNTLDKPGPVRIKLACRDPSQIRGESQVFFNGESHRLRWEVEKENTAKTTPSASFDRQRDKESPEEEGEEDKDQNPKHDPRFMKQGSNKKNNTGTSREYGSGNKQHQVDKENQMVEEESATKTAEDSSLNMSEEQLIETQQSNIVAQNQEDEMDFEEELLDYDEDPIYSAKIEMAALEKKVEERADKLMKDKAIKVTDNQERVLEEAKNRTAVNNESGILGEKNLIKDSYGSNGQEDFTSVRNKEADKAVQRRSSRNQGNTKIQDKAEALKRKNNEITEMEDSKQGRKEEPCGRINPTTAKQASVAAF